MPTLSNVKQYFRLVNYLAAAQIFLQDNFLLERPLTPEDIKPRLLGHWGTCPGINFVYTHLNYSLTQEKRDLMYIVGPGHGFPALQANLFVEGTLSSFYKDVPHNIAGFSKVIRDFSWPYGYPSHTNPGAPGCILEGGELGYSLSTSYGAALDNPDLTVVCLVGDGEAETGPTATAWHANKFLDPRTCGAVLPILHLNGYKISGPTIYGRMSDAELEALFTGYGYEVHFVDHDAPGDIHATMARTLKKAFKTIDGIHTKARSGKEVLRPKWPMIILRTPKGWTGVKKVHGKDAEGNYLSHQVMLTLAKTDMEELQQLSEWLQSYKVHELFDPQKGFASAIKAMIPPKERRIGMSKHVNGGMRKKLKMPALEKQAFPLKALGAEEGLAMHALGRVMRDIVKKNGKQHQFRLFSPDETTSNKLDAIFETTNRISQWPLLPHDEFYGRSGQVVEMLSEHTLQGMMQGYVLTGRYGVFTSYEAFIQIVASMTDQYAKFLKASQEIAWRKSVPPFIYLLSSLGWRQDHNGYSHQNPGFISNILEKHGNLARVYFPVDVNSALAIFEKCLEEDNAIHVIVCGKQEMLQWLSLKQARKYLESGIALWDFVSDPRPDLVIAGAGGDTTQEALAGVDLIRKHFPAAKVRFVNIMEMTAIGVADPRSQTTQKDFDAYFTADKPVLINYHGYTADIKHLLFDSTNNTTRFTVHGYEEQGSTTSPFDMHIRNHTSRYHILLWACEQLAAKHLIGKHDAKRVTKEVEKILVDHRAYIRAHGDDPEFIKQWKWQQ